MEGNSVFMQESDASHSARVTENPCCEEGEEDGTREEEGCALNITTTVQEAIASPVSTTSPASPGTFYVVKTVTVSHSPQTLHYKDENGKMMAQSNGPPAPSKSSATHPSELRAPPPKPASGPRQEGRTSSPSKSVPSTISGDTVGEGENGSAGCGSGGGGDVPIRAGPVREKPLIPENMVKGKGGAAAPQPLRVAPKSQLHVVPTGRSDSDTDNDGADSESTSIASPGLPERRHSEDENQEEEEEQRFVDEFGFVIDEDGKEKDERFIRGIDGKQVARREIKWANMAADWNRTNTKMHAKLKERCRKGIPSRLRGGAWQLLVGSRTQMMSPENAGVYVALRDKKLRDKEVDEVLGRDLTRTFPNHVFFKDEGGVGQTFLRNVLHAYAGCDPEVGYTQGMAFVVGTLSTQMAEEESFWALHELMYHERYKMRELYMPGFPLLHQFFHQMRRLLAKLLPKLSKRFEELEIEPSFYASQWFMTLFVYHFPFRAVLRIWDIFLSEGWKIIFRTGIALMKWEEKRLLAMTFDELLPTLKTLADGKDTKELVRRAHLVKFKTADLNRYGDEYWAMKGTTLA